MAKKKQLIENAIYASIIGECEGMEHDKRYRGNGHHLAQRLTYQISVGILPPQQKKIVGVMSRTPMLTKEIASLVKLKSSVVSAVLVQLEKNTLIVGSKRNGKLKSWYLQIVQ